MPNQIQFFLSRQLFQTAVLACGDKKCIRAMCIYIYIIVEIREKCISHLAVIIYHAPNVEEITEGDLM